MLPDPACISQDPPVALFSRPQNSLLQLFLGGETSCPPCFAVQALGGLGWWWHLCYAVDWGDEECGGPAPGWQKFVVLLQREEGKALVVGAERWPKSPKAAEACGQYDHAGDRVVRKAARGDMAQLSGSWGPIHCSASS